MTFQLYPHERNKPWREGTRLPSSYRPQLQILLPSRTKIPFCPCPCPIWTKQSPLLELSVLLRSAVCAVWTPSGVEGEQAGGPVDAKALSSTHSGRLLSPRHSPEQTTRRTLAPCSDSLSPRRRTRLRPHCSNLGGSLV